MDSNKLKLPKQIERGYKQLAVKPSTHKLVVDDCVKEFLRIKPDMKGIPISQDYIVRRIALSYLDRL